LVGAGGGDQRKEGDERTHDKGSRREGEKREVNAVDEKE
jgi:hypothetical protein